MSLSLVAGYGSSSDEEEEEENKQVAPVQKNEKVKGNKAVVEKESVISSEAKTEAVSFFPSGGKLSFGALPKPAEASFGLSALGAHKKKKKKKRKKRKNKDRVKEDLNEGSISASVLSLNFEKETMNTIKKMNENKKVIGSKGKQEHIDLENAESVGPQRPSAADIVVEAHHLNTGGENSKPQQEQSAWAKTYGTRFMDRDVKKYIESGGDISKLAEHPEFSSLSAADISKESKLKAMIVAAEGTGTKGMGEDRPAETTFWNVKEGKIKSGFIDSTMGKRKHQIGTLVADAERFQSELERQKVKSSKGMAKARNMYGF